MANDKDDKPATPPETKPAKKGYKMTVVAVMPNPKFIRATSKLLKDGQSPHEVIVDSNRGYKVGDELENVIPAGNDRFSHSED